MELKYTIQFNVMDKRLNPSTAADCTMPKDLDKTEDGGDKEEPKERTPNAEEMSRKRIRANTPSPHRGNSPQGK